MLPLLLPGVNHERVQARELAGRVHILFDDIKEKAIQAAEGLESQQERKCRPQREAVEQQSSHRHKPMTRKKAAFREISFAFLKSPVSFII